MIFFNDDNDPCQFGSVAGRSTTLALIRLTHMLFEASDDTSNLIRILFVDFSRAFDVIDHNVIRRKLDSQCPLQLRNWLLSFVCKRVQFVKVGDYVSNS